MDDSTKRALVAAGVATVTGAMATALAIDLQARAETKKLHDEYVRKWTKLGPVVSLFEQLGEWLGEVGEVNPSSSSSQDFIEGFLERAEFLGIACRALSDDDLPREGETNAGSSNGG